MPGTERPTHYETLAVDPAATTEQIREAYRRLARDHHPDRLAASGSDGRSMPQINEAYRVLSDPARRAVYDASLRTPPRPMSATPDAAPSDSGRPSTTVVAGASPARIPWRSLLVVGVIAVIGLVVLAQFTDPPTPTGPDGIVRVGDCVAIEANGFARETSCVGDPAVDVVVASIVPFGTECPVGTVGHQDRQGLGIVCVEMPVEIPG